MSFPGKIFISSLLDFDHLSSLIKDIHINVHFWDGDRTWWCNKNRSLICTHSVPRYNEKWVWVCLIGLAALPLDSAETVPYNLYNHPQQREI
jgi:hypothetical protein